MPSSIWTQSVSEISSFLKSDLRRGLSAAEAAKRLQEFGPNVLPKKGGPPWWKLLLSQFSNIIIWLLIVAAIISGVLGEVVDAWAILAIVLLNAALGFFQEYRAERSLEALQQLAAPMTKVVRDGILQLIPSDQVVFGDLVLLEAGDRVPADGRIVSNSHLLIDESSLTGESVPVSKTDKVLNGNLVLADRKNMAFMGSAVVGGKGHLLITETGLKTEIGKIAASLMVKEREVTPLQRRLDILGRKLVYLCLGIVAIVFGLGILRGTDMVEMLLVSLSLAVAAIPEGLPAMVTIALSIGVRRMAKKNALIRRLSSVETLGSANVIFSDKTGTLTQNAMTVRSIWVDQKFISVSGTGYAPVGEFEGQAHDLDFVLKIATLCNNAGLFQKEGRWVLAGDPTEGALLSAAGKGGFFKQDLEKEYQFCEEIPFDSERKMMSVLRQHGEQKILFTKGAPDVLLKHASRWLVDGKELPLGDSQKREIAEANAKLASQAYRILSVAYQTNLALPLEQDLVFVGLIAMIDPPRPGVKEAIQECKEAGIRTVMVTGDHKATALAIAQELGLDGGKAVNGNEIDKMTDEELHGISVFSRINAAHKLRIIKAYHHEVTAMTGDGVNDAPAIHAADIGIAMGIAGTEVTKEASDLVILDDNFATIVHAVEEGRGIYDNIVKFINYLLSSNMAEILVIFVVMLLGLSGPDGRPFVALLPIQLLWMNLITDGFPAISLAMDPIDPLAMKRPPRPRSEQLLGTRFTLSLLMISTLVASGSIGACFYGLKTSVAMAQTMTFTTLIVSELIKVQMVRVQYRMKYFSNPYVIWALLGSFVLQLFVLYVPSLQIVFGTVPLSLMDWGVIFGICAVIWFIGILIPKFFLRKN